METEANECKIIIKMVNGDQFQEQTAKTTDDSRFVVVWTESEPKEMIGFWYSDHETTQIDSARKVMQKYYGPAFPILDIYHECSKSDSKKVIKYLQKVHEYTLKAYELVMTLEAMKLKES